jgi:hypothetical protein
MAISGSASKKVSNRLLSHVPYLSRMQEECKQMQEKMREMEAKLAKSAVSSAVKPSSSSKPTAGPR